jgi:hypothetical protein
VPDPATYRPAPGSIPVEPGVYRFRDPHGRVIYVGKAKSLRSRLNSYFADLAASLLHEGALPHEFFLIVDGTVGIVRDGERVNTLGPGDYLGEIALLDGDPQVPQDVHFVGVVFMGELAGHGQGALGISGIVEGLLKNNRLIPGDAAYGQIAHAASLAGKRELLQHRKQARHHLLLMEAGKPDTQIKTVSHNSKEFIVILRCKIAQQRTR